MPNIGKTHAKSKPLDMPTLQLESVANVTPVTVPYPASLTPAIGPSASHPRPRRTSGQAVKAKFAATSTPAKENSRAASNVPPVSKQTAQSAHPSRASPRGATSLAIPLLANSPSPSFGSLPSWAGSSSQGLPTASCANSKVLQVPSLAQAESGNNPPGARHQRRAEPAPYPESAAAKPAEVVVPMRKTRMPPSTDGAEVPKGVRLLDKQMPSATLTEKTPGHAAGVANGAQREHSTKTISSQPGDCMPVKEPSKRLGSAGVESGHTDSKMLRHRLPDVRQVEGGFTTNTPVSVTDSAKAQHPVHSDVLHSGRAALIPTLTTPGGSITVGKKQNVRRKTEGSRGDMLLGRRCVSNVGRCGNTWLDTAEGFMSGLESQWAALQGSWMGSGAVSVPCTGLIPINGKCVPRSSPVPSRVKTRSAPPSPAPSSAASLASPAVPLRFPGANAAADATSNPRSRSAASSCRVSAESSSSTLGRATGSASSTPSISPAGPTHCPTTPGAPLSLRDLAAGHTQPSRSTSRVEMIASQGSDPQHALHKPISSTAAAHRIGAGPVMVPHHGVVKSMQSTSCPPPPLQSAALPREVARPNPSTTVKVARNSDPSASKWSSIENIPLLQPSALHASSNGSSDRQAAAGPTNSRTTAKAPVQRIASRELLCSGPTSEETLSSAGGMRLTPNGRAEARVTQGVQAGHASTLHVMATRKGGKSGHHFQSEPSECEATPMGLAEHIQGFLGKGAGKLTPPGPNSGKTPSALVPDGVSVKQAMSQSRAIPERGARSGPTPPSPLLSFTPEIPRGSRPSTRGTTPPCVPLPDAKVRLGMPASSSLAYQALGVSDQVSRTPTPPQAAFQSQKKTLGTPGLAQTCRVESSAPGLESLQTPDARSTEAPPAHGLRALRSPRARDTEKAGKALKGTPGSGSASKKRRGKRPEWCDDFVELPGGEGSLTPGDGQEPDGSEESASIDQGQPHCRAGVLGGGEAAREPLKREIPGGSGMAPVHPGPRGKMHDGPHAGLVADSGSKGRRLLLACDLLRGLGAASRSQPSAEQGLQVVNPMGGNRTARGLIIDASVPPYFTDIRQPSGGQPAGPDLTFRSQGRRMPDPFNGMSLSQVLRKPHSPAKLGSAAATPAKTN